MNIFVNISLHISGYSSVIYIECLNNWNNIISVILGYLSKEVTMSVSTESLPGLYKLFFVVLMPLHRWKRSIIVATMSPYIPALCISRYISCIVKIQQMIAILFSALDQYWVILRQLVFHYLWIYIYHTYFLYICTGYPVKTRSMLKNRFLRSNNKLSLWK